MRVVAACLALVAAWPGRLAAEPVLSRAQALAAGRALGEAGKDAVRDAATRPDLSEVPGFQGTAVPESGYRELGAGIEDAARDALPGHAVGRYVEQSAGARPRFNIDRRNPAVELGSAIEAEPAATLGSALTGAYSDCRAISVESTPTPEVEARCTEWGLDELVGCERVLELTCTHATDCDAGGIVVQSVRSDMRWDYRYPHLTIGSISDNYWEGDCAVFDRRTTFVIEDIERIKDFRLIESGFDDWIRIRVNGHTVRIGPYGGDRLDVVSGQVRYAPSRTGACELHVSWHQRLDLDIKPYLRSGLNTLDMRVVVAGGGEGWMRFIATQYCGCEWQERIDSSCAAYEQRAANGSCGLESERCLAPDETRRIHGLPVHRGCWREARTYACATGETREEAYCAELRERGCRQIDSSCLEPLADGSCHEHQQTFRCPASTVPHETVLECGEQLFCLEGACFETGHAPNRDFALAASHLGALEAGAKDLDPDSLDIFAGEALACEKTVLGFKNCCKDSGWGLDLGLAQCDEAEQRLGEKREAGMCHYIGRYKSGSFFTRRRYESFCCFRSKLGRIIHQQGRPQLGLGWGEAESADCRGLTPEELTRIDFAAVDFSEFFADALRIAGQIARPEDEDLARHLRDRLLRLLPR